MCRTAPKILPANQIADNLFSNERIIKGFYSEGVVTQPHSHPVSYGLRAPLQLGYTEGQILGYWWIESIWVQLQSYANKL